MADPIQAPVCEIIPTISDTQPPQARLPAIPIATDLASALAALNAMRAWMLQMMQTQPGHNFWGGGHGSGGAGGRGGGKTPQPKPPKMGRWIQKDITRQKVRVFNPQDHEQYVDVSRVTRLVMRDTVTGEEWVWTGTSSNTG